MHKTLLTGGHYPENPVSPIKESGTDSCHVSSGVNHRFQMLFLSPL